MPKKRISRVELEKFRGATTTTRIDFDTSKPIVVIFGENGSGKSTVGNAFDFVCNKTKGSLESMSSTRHTHLVSIGCDAADLKVRLHQGASVWEGSQDGRAINVTPADDIPKVSTLRRSELLKLVEADPAKRFDTIRKFIDFDKIEASEQKLRDAERRSKLSLDRNAELHTQAKNSLDTLWTNDGQPDASAKEWATGKLGNDLTNARMAVNSFDAAITSIDTFASAKNSIASAITELAEAEADLVAVNALIAADAAGAADSGVKLVDMLNKVKTVISVPYDKSQCPACLSEFDLEKLRTDVQQRIDSLESSSKLSKELKLKSDGVTTKKNLLERSTRKFYESTKSLADPISQSLGESDDFAGLLARFVALDFDAEVFREAEITEISSIVDEAKPLFVAKRDAIKRDIHLYDAIKAALDLVDKTELEVEDEDAIAKRLHKALEIVHGTRIEITQNILDAVFDDFSRYWEAIHPGEPIKPTKLSLSETARGSLNQLGSFDGHDDISPQAYFSESHLDTLGFCYWLAIAKYSSNGDTIIVLDDVFTSVDSEHIDRVIDLLNTESEHFNQVIITTHQRRWHDSYKFGVRSKDKAFVLELDRWDTVKGIVTYPSPMEIDRLEHLMAAGPFDRQSICSKAGVLLEQAFDELTKHYRCSMPRGHRNDYTLNDYVSAAKKLFGQLKIKRPDLAGVDEELPFQNTFNDLVPFVTVRNQVGAHFNLTAAEYSDVDITRFGNLTISLIRGLLCQTCLGMALKENRHTGEWACGCKNTRMFPKSL